MANKNAKNVVNEPDVHVVAPSNMGKGLAWNDGAKQYEVAISKAHDNMLQMRDDGLYYGFTAKEELRSLYVSNNGDDSNPGTRDRPLRTLQRVADLLKDAPVTYTINLHENHTFDSPNIFNVPHATLEVQAYGPTVDSTYPVGTPCNVYYRGYAAKTYPRPTIRFKSSITNNVIWRDRINFDKGTFLGIKFSVTTTYPADDGSLGGNFPGILNSRDVTELIGCVVHRVDVGPTGKGYRDDVLLRGNVFWVTSTMTGVVATLAAYHYTDVFKLLDWNAGHNAGGCGFPDYQGLVDAPGVDNMKNTLRGAVIARPEGLDLIQK